MTHRLKNTYISISLRFKVIVFGILKKKNCHVELKMNFIHMMGNQGLSVAIVSISDVTTWQLQKV